MRLKILDIQNNLFYQVFAVIRAIGVIRVDIWYNADCEGWSKEDDLKEWMSDPDRFLKDIPGSRWYMEFQQLGDAFQIPEKAIRRIEKEDPEFIRFYTDYQEACSYHDPSLGNSWANANWHMFTEDSTSRCPAPNEDGSYTTDEQGFTPKRYLPQEEFYYERPLQGCGSHWTPIYGEPEKVENNPRLERYVEEYSKWMSKK